MIFTAQFDPIIFSIGPVAVRWYSLMYIVALLIAIGLGNYRAKRSESIWTKDNVGDAAFYLFIGAVLGVGLVMQFFMVGSKSYKIHYLF